jgi:hypothetical protein
MNKYGRSKEILKKLTNTEIVNDVARNFQVKQLINHMIDYSVKDHSNDDLCQYIYEYLLTYNNVKLNQMYNDKKLRNFIALIIKMQRNGGVKGKNTIYVNQLRIKNSNEFFFESHDIEDITTYDFTADLIIEYIDKKSEMVDDVYYSSEQLKFILAFTLLKKYFMSDLTQVKLAGHLGLSRLTIGKLLKIARQDTLKWWQQTGQYLDI